MQKGVASAVAIYAFAALFLLYEMGLQVSPSVMTHQLMRDLHTDAAGLGLIAGLYFYSYTFMQIPSGLLFDRYSTRWILTFAIVICALGAFFFGSTHTLYFASLGRFLMGIGSAFAFVGVLTVAARWFEPQYFAFLVGIAQCLAALGAIGGELPFDYLVHAIGWRASILWLASGGVLLAVLAVLIVKHKAAKQTLSMHLGVWKSLQLLVRNEQTWWVALYAFCSWAPITAFAAFWGVPYLMVLYDIGSHQAALAVTMVWLGLGITSPILGLCSDWLGRRCLLLSFCSLLGCFSTSAILFLPGIDFPVMLVFLFFFWYCRSRANFELCSG